MPYSTALPNQPSRRLLSNRKVIVRHNGTDYVVRRYKVLPTTTATYAYDVYVKIAGKPLIPLVEGGDAAVIDFSTLTSGRQVDPNFNEAEASDRPPVWYGRVGTERLPDNLEALSRGAERTRQVQQFQAKRYRFAYRLTHQAFPESQDGTHSMGSIEFRPDARFESQLVGLEVMRQLRDWWGCNAELKVGIAGWNKEGQLMVRVEALENLPRQAWFYPYWKWFNPDKPLDVAQRQAEVAMKRHLAQADIHVEPSEFLSTAKKTTATLQEGENGEIA